MRSVLPLHKRHPVDQKPAPAGPVILGFSKGSLTTDSADRERSSSGAVRSTVVSDLDTWVESARPDIGVVKTSPITVQRFPDSAFFSRMCAKSEILLVAPSRGGGRCVKWQGEEFLTTWSFESVPGAPQRRGAGLGVGKTSRNADRH